jgi:hypothetical protein
MTNYNKTNLNIILTLQTWDWTLSIKTWYVDEIQFIMCKYMENETQLERFWCKVSFMFLFIKWRVMDSNDDGWTMNIYRWTKLNKLQYFILHTPNWIYRFFFNVKFYGGGLWMSFMTKLPKSVIVCLDLISTNQL